jgi:hypothetical protein
MRPKPSRLAVLAAAISLAAQPAQAAGCPAKSTRFEDIVVALNKARVVKKPSKYSRPAGTRTAAV